MVLVGGWVYTATRGPSTPSASFDVTFVPTPVDTPSAALDGGGWLAAIADMVPVGEGVLAAPALGSASVMVTSFPTASPTHPYDDYGGSAWTNTGCRAGVYDFGTVVCDVTPAFTPEPLPTLSATPYFITMTPVPPQTMDNE